MTSSNNTSSNINNNKVVVLNDEEDDDTEDDDNNVDDEAEEYDRYNRNKMAKYDGRCNLRSRILPSSVQRRRSQRQETTGHV